MFNPFRNHQLDRIEKMLLDLKTLGVSLMSAVSDFAAKQQAFNDDVATDLTAIQTAIAALNAQIAALQNSQGTLSPEDQALLDDLQTKGTALQSQADALAGKQPPAPPTGS